MKRNRATMELSELGLSEKALNIATTRPKEWALLLYAQLLDDEIYSVQFYLKKFPPIDLSNHSRFEPLRSFSDLNKTVDDLLNNLNVVSNFSSTLTSMSTEENTLSLGGDGSDADPIEIKKLAEYVANLYREISVFLTERKAYQTNLEVFINRNIGHTDDLDLEIIKAVKITCNCIDVVNKFIINNTSKILETITGFSDFCRQSVQTAASGKNADRTFVFKLEAYGLNELIPHVQAATKALVLIHQERSRKTSEATTDVQAVKNQDFTSLLEVVKWISGFPKVTLTQLRAALLPLDLFPGAVIDDMNERALELADEMAFEESNNAISVNREALLKVISAWQKT